jgi:hypothetical protein
MMDEFPTYAKTERKINKVNFFIYVIGTNLLQEKAAMNKMKTFGDSDIHLTSQ